MKRSKTKTGKPPGDDPYKYHAVVRGSHRKRGKGARRVGDADPREKLELTLSLRGPDLPSADALADGPLTPSQFRKQYCASRSDADKVAKVLKRYGLKIESTTLETRSMRVSGTVAAVEAAFHARLGIYESKRQGRYRDREDDYKVPPGIDGMITAILGLGQRRVVKKRLARGQGVGPLKASGPCRFRAALPLPAWRRRGPEDCDRGVRERLFRRRRHGLLPELQTARAEGRAGADSCAAARPQAGREAAAGRSRRRARRRQGSDDGHRDHRRPVP